MATCDECGALLSEIEAAGRETGTCNECLRLRRKPPLRRFRRSNPALKQKKRRTKKEQ